MLGVAHDKAWLKAVRQQLDSILQGFFFGLEVSLTSLPLAGKCS